MYHIKIFKDGRWLELSKYKTNDGAKRYLKKYRRQEMARAKIYEEPERQYRLEDYNGNILTTAHQLDLFAFA